jgi:hypothetical protein
MKTIIKKALLSFVIVAMGATGYNAHAGDLNCTITDYYVLTRHGELVHIYFETCIEEEAIVEAP